ncbi:hypothetical protein BGX21_009023 [Mortierella sp. AD011]|nr:hypothetical protein BGX20_006407 [Mortierella sp. AD010]KAF9397297.1 hypothetical protein BGX21_009023 [Mortierella sp. AD011]
MTDFAQDHSALRSRGPSLPKLNLLPDSQYLQHYSQAQHPFDTTSKPGNNDFDIDMDMDMDFDTTPVSNSQNDASATSKPFVSAHPSPDTSDESDCEQTQADETSSSADHADSAIAIPATSAQKQLQRERAEHQHIQSESPLSHHLFLTPVPIPKSSRTPPHSPLNNYRQHSSFSTSTPPGSASSVLPAPCSDSATVDALIREHVHPNMVSHATDKAFFWHVGKLSEFSFSDRFVRSRMFEIKDTTSASIHGSVEPTDKSVPTSQQAANSWRLRLYPHGRGDRHRDSEYVGLYLQQDAVRTIMNRRSSTALTTLPIEGFSSSAPTPFIGRGSFSPNPRRSISGASSLPSVRRHVTLFLATENGDCLAKQDLIEWFSGSEGGLGFPRMVSRKTVQDAVKDVFINNDDEEECELGIVAGVIFHDL